MGKVDLIKDRCIGCGACMSIAPENFTFGDDGRAEMINSVATESAIEASETCPVSAIVVESFNECNCECNKETKCTCGDECNCTEENNCGCISDCTCGEECICSTDCNCGCKEKENLEN